MKCELNMGLDTEGTQIGHKLASLSPKSTHCAAVIQLTTHNPSHQKAKQQLTSDSKIIVAADKNSQ